MTRHAASQQQGVSSPSLVEGDQAAACGEWLRAVTIWDALRTGPDAAEVERRIAWFLTESGAALSPAKRQLHERARSTSLLLIAIASGMIGTIAVLIGIGSSGTVQVIASVAAWTGYITAGILAIVYAKQLGAADRGSISLDDEAVALAYDVAARIADGPLPDDTGGSVRR